MFRNHIAGSSTESFFYLPCGLECQCGFRAWGLTHHPRDPHAGGWWYQYLTPHWHSEPGKAPLSWGQSRLHRTPRVGLGVALEGAVAATAIWEVSVPAPALHREEPSTLCLLIVAQPVLVNRFIFFCRDFLSPGGNIIAFWVPEDKDIPARVTPDAAAHSGKRSESGTSSTSWTASCTGRRTGTTCV